MELKCNVLNGLAKRSFIVACLLVLLLVATACSVLTNFVVINASDQPIEVRYKVKNKPQVTPPILMLPIIPAVKPITQVDKQVAWRDLTTSEFKFDPESRTVVVSVPSGEALRIEKRDLVDGPQDEASRSSNFAIEEITISGSSGVINLVGDQARKSFIRQSGKTYTLTYK